MRTSTIAGVAVVWTALASPLVAQKGGMQPSTAPAGRTGAASGDANAGTFSDGQLTIVLRRSGTGYAGTATVFGERFPVQVSPQGGILVGAFDDEGEAVPLRLRVQGDVMEVDADGERHVLRRQGAASSAGATARAPASGGSMGGAAAAPRSGGSTGGGGGSGLAATAQDQQIVRLLLSSRWCSFSYSQT